MSFAVKFLLILIAACEWSQQPETAAFNALYFCANKLAIIPASTSPEPAVAK